MWTALAMTAVLTGVPGQVGDLTLTNVRPTLGILGSPRKDGEAPKLIPGDAFFISFDVDGLKVADDGKIKYSVGMEWTNKDGKIVYKEEPQQLEVINSLGGAKVPAFIAAQTFPDTPGGEYSLKAMVKDHAANKEATFTRKFEVIPPTFGMVRLGLSYDVEGKIHAPPVAVPGQRLQVNFYATGFERDKTSKQPNISFKMRVLENGRPVLGKDAGGNITDAPENHKMIPANFFLYLNRPGKYTVELEATDEVSKKKTAQSFDINVVDVK